MQLGHWYELHHWKLGLIIFIICIVGFLLIIGRDPSIDSDSSVDKFQPLAPTAVEEEPICATMIEHKPVHLRLGEIVALNDSELILQSQPLAGEVSNTLQVTLGAETQIVEIRVPNYLGDSQQQALKNGGQVIERIPASRDSLYVGQQVAIVSASDTYCQSNIVPERIEYEIIIDTTGEL